MSILIVVGPAVAYGIPIALGVRWLLRQRQRNESRLAALPTREQLETITDRLEALAGRLEALDERQVFLERLLQPPRAQEPSREEPIKTRADSV